MALSARISQKWYRNRASKDRMRNAWTGKKEGSEQHSTGEQGRWERQGQETPQGPDLWNGGACRAKMGGRGWNTVLKSLGKGREGRGCRGKERQRTGWKEGAGSEGVRDLTYERDSSRSLFNLSAFK